MIRHKKMKRSSRKWDFEVGLGPESSLVAQKVKRLPAMWETQVQSLGWEDPQEKEMAIHSGTLAWKIPWTEKPGRLWSMGLQSWTRVSNFIFTFPLIWMPSCSSQSMSFVPGIGQRWMVFWGVVHEGVVSSISASPLLPTPSFKVSKDQDESPVFPLSH